MRRIIVIVLVVSVVAGLLVVAMPLSISSRAEEQQCRFRLRRLGLAVNQWVEDHGHEAFPPIRNPPAGADWDPQRSQGADQVLWFYLYGDVPRPPRPGESPAEYQKRLRRSALTICPLTDLPFWYNERLRQLTPNEVVEGRSEGVPYFFSQRGRDGSYPIEDAEGNPAVHGVVGRPELVQISRDEVEALAAKIAEEEQRDPRNPEIDYWRHRLDAYRRRLAEAGGERFSMGRLMADVEVLSRK